MSLEAVLSSTGLPICSVERMTFVTCLGRCYYDFYFLSHKVRSCRKNYYDGGPESIRPFYLEVRSRGLDVSWQSDRGDLTVLP